MRLPKAWLCPVSNIGSYKYFVLTIFTKQIPCAFSIYSSWYGAWWYWLLLPWILPFQIAYCAALLVELILVTVLFPIIFIPYLVFLLLIVQFLFYIFRYIVAFIGLVPQDYVKYEKMRDLKTALKGKGIKRNLRKFYI